MSWLKNHIKNRPNYALSIPAVLCFMQFLSELIDIIKTRTFDSNAITQLLSSADGFESVVLFIIMLVLKTKNK